MTEWQRHGDTGPPEETDYTGKHVKVGSGPMSDEKGIVVQCYYYGDWFPHVRIKLDLDSLDPGVTWGPYSSRFIVLLDDKGNPLP